MGARSSTGAADAAPTAGALARAVGGTVRGDAGAVLRGCAPLEEAGPSDLSFLARPDYLPRALASRAGCIIVGDATALPGRTVIASTDPYRAFALAMAF